MKSTPKRELDPVFKPVVTGGRASKDAILAIRVAPTTKDWIEDELLRLGVAPKDRAHFYRGAILAAIGNVKRAQSPAWKKFLAAIQPAAQKHLGAGLELGNASVIEHLGYDGPTIAFK